MFGTFIDFILDYRFYTIPNLTKPYHVDDSRGQSRCYPIHFRPLSSTIDHLSIETFQRRCVLSMWSGVESTVHDNRYIVRGFVYNVLLFCSSNLAQLSSNVHGLFLEKTSVRLFDGLLRISTRNLFRDTNNSLRELFRTFVRIQRVIWDQLLASKAEII